MAKSKTELSMPSVLAFEKKLVVSDGLLSGAKWDERHEVATPLPLREKSVRGTISNRLKKAIKNDPAKVNAEIEKANLQTVDACTLEAEQDTLVLSFSLKVLGGIETPSACNNPTFAAAYKNVAEAYVEKNGFKELARRYALNLANGRYLWRNRVGVEKLEVVITAGEQKWVIDDALSLRLRDFENCGEYETVIDEIAAEIAAALCGRKEYLLLKVTAYALVGQAQEVYPSEELVLDKGNGRKSKILYQVDGVAAMHSQKLGNAIRTIDTWYPEYEDENRPIAIEVYGAVTNQGRAYRQPSDKVDFYTLFDRYVLEGTLDNEEQEDYVMAVLVRGGVFGESGKD